MLGGFELTDATDVPELGSFLFTVRDMHGEHDEAILVRCADPEAAPPEGAVLDSVEADDADGDDDSSEPLAVEAWINRCPHEDQRLDRGQGAAMRDGQVICPKHGSMFDSCSGYCDNGEAKGTNLVPLDLEIEDGVVYLTDDDYRLVGAGGIDDDDDGPSSTSHIGF
ncbi:Rieske (2Fe-2S) protein [Halobium salinum]|uniref:Rieske (2Fe-2S) protein n=1 Tax=Halobium salinum TaxID=1364940 RepID=A0ABD5PD98_9EURY|nr:Rieske 2Fe-2S domain-containing protein [Halobium salinum]